VPIISLEYHDVVPKGRWDDSGFPGPAAASYKLSMDRFLEHLDGLAEVGASVGPTVHQALGGNRNAILLTFDDGGSSATAIGGKLAERRWCAHFFVATDRIGQSGFLTREEIAELSKHHVIGSHSASHPTRMSRLTDAQLLDEWRRSIQVLEDVVQQRVTVASVPGGYYSGRVAETAAAAGIEVLFTSEPLIRIERVNACSVLGRYTLRRDHTAAYVRQLVGRPPTTRAAQWLNWNVKKVGKRLAGDLYLRARAILLDRRRS
jgi:peptidoglycan/xylan/chitin deacetylase (PgdA/CDA1 family)